MTTTTATLGSTPRIGARVLLLDPDERVLLIHARDPDAPDNQWWELPGGGVDPGETLPDTARREVAEETGLVLDSLGPCVWIRETHFHYRGRDHHRREHVYLARTHDIRPKVTPKRTPNEHLGLLGQHWWTHHQLAETPHKLLPPALPDLLPRILTEDLPAPLQLHE